MSDPNSINLPGMDDASTPASKPKKAEGGTGRRKFNTDPSKPLSNERYERMVHIVAKGEGNWTDAYLSTAVEPYRGTRASASSHASSIKRQACVGSRFKYLMEHKYSTASNPAPGTKTNSLNVTPATLTDLLPEDLPTKEYLLRVLSAIVARGGADSTTLNATEKLLKHLENETEKDLQFNPDLVADHMLQIAGWSGEQIVQEMGGLGFIIDRICAICKVTRADIALASQTPAST